jgi:hypothetical protein
MWAALQLLWKLSSRLIGEPAFSTNRNQDAPFRPQPIVIETMAFAGYPLFRTYYYYYDLYRLFKTGYSSRLKFRGIPRRKS